MGDEDMTLAEFDAAFRVGEPVEVVGAARVTVEEFAVPGATGVWSSWAGGWTASGSNLLPSAFAVTPGTRPMTVPNLATAEG